MIVVYASSNEILVGTSETEPELIKEYFHDGGRDLDDYDRNVIKESATVIEIKSSLRVDFGLPVAELG